MQAEHIAVYYERQARLASLFATQSLPTNKAQIERGLTDRNFFIRQAAACRDIQEH